MNEPRPKFCAGRVVITPNALENLTEEDITATFSRHVCGDWGDLDEHDRNENESSLIHELRLFSVYRSAGGVRFYIITEADRSVTTILLPEDY